jgi:uncharacterized protein (TIGR02145 family)
MKNKNLLMTVAIFIIAFSTAAQENGSFTDSRDGKVYKTIKIGTQTWMAENLAFKPDSGNYWAYNNDANNVSKYGYLYDWKTAITVCPTGWHLPTDDEWTILITYLGGEKVAGGKLKEIDTTVWTSPNKGATNESGFTALPGGNRNSKKGAFFGQGGNGFWWSATEYCPSYAWYREMNSYSNSVGRGNFFAETSGFYMRCVRDN